MLRDSESGLIRFLQHCFDLHSTSMVEMVVDLLNYNLLEFVNTNPQVCQQFKKLIKDNLTLVLDSLVDVSINESNLNFLLEFVDMVQFLDKDRSLENGGKIGFLSHFIMCNPNSTDPIFKILTSSFKENLPADELKARLEKLLKEDSRKKNFFSYTFLTRNNALHTFVKNLESFLKIQNSEASLLSRLTFPKVKEITVCLREKTTLEQEREERLIEEIKKQVEDAKKLLKKPEENKQDVADFLSNWKLEEASLEAYKPMRDQLLDISKKHKGQFLRIFNHREIYEWFVVEDDAGVAAMLDFILSQDVRLLGIDVEYSKADCIVNRDEERWKAESQSDKSHSSIVCSLQLCALGRLYFIDWAQMNNRPAAADLLRLLFEDAKYLKLLHGCQTDLSLIFSSMGIVVRNVFDTARAYSDIHGLENHPGLGSLSEKVLGIPLDKAFQKSNWKIRPLPEEMLEYALTDAAILIPLYLELQAGLDSKQGLALENWVRVNSLEKNVCKGRPVYQII